MRTYTADNADSLYRVALTAVLTEGQPVAPRGMRTLELLGPTFRLTDARRNVITIRDRRMNYTFSVAEWLWILTGRNDVASIAYFNKNIAPFSDDGVTFAGAYGPRVAAQLPYVIRTLRADPDSRQAVLTIWTPTPDPSKDIPCTVALQFFLRDGELHAHTYMRSNDVWLGFPYDIFNFTQLQAYVAMRLDVVTGEYLHTVGSFHLYERNDDDARRVLSGNDGWRWESPTLTPMPLNVSRVFEELATPRGATDEVAALWQSWLYPWDVYASVLAYRTHRDLWRVLPPYRQLLQHLG